MAAELLRARAKKEGDDLIVESAGTWGVDGQGAQPFARLVMQGRGLSLDSHIARTVSRESLQNADLVLVMTRSHKDALSAEFPEARSKLHLISELVGLEYDIADPYGGPRDAYETCATDLERLIERGYPHVKQWLTHAPRRLTNV